METNGLMHPLRPLTPQDQYRLVFYEMLFFKIDNGPSPQPHCTGFSLLLRSTWSMRVLL